MDASTESALASLRAERAALLQAREDWANGAGKPDATTPWRLREKLEAIEEEIRNLEAFNAQRS